MKDKRNDPRWKNQHCTNPNCLTFSHTAEYCDMPQPRWCKCPYDHPERKWNK